MVDLNQLFSISFVSFFIIMIGYLVARSFESKDYVGFCIGLFLLLLCLIGLISIITQLMIEDSVILQIDATLIAGLLILLSITSFWGKDEQNIIVTKITKNRGIYWSPRQVFFPVIPFSISAMATLAHSLAPQMMRYFSVSMTLAGFLILLIIAFLVTSKDRTIKTS